MGNSCCSDAASAAPRPARPGVEGMLYENAWAAAKAQEPGFGVDAGEEAAKRAQREARRLFKLAGAVSSGLDTVLVVGAAGCVGAGVLAALLEGTAFSIAALDPALRGPLPPRVEGFARAAEALGDDALRRVLARCADVIYSADSGDRAPYAADPGHGWPSWATLPFYTAIDSIDCHFIAQISCCHCCHIFCKNDSVAPG